MKKVEIFCDMLLEIICPDCGMLFEVYPKREWKDYKCPYCKKPFTSKIIVQAFWLDEGESGEPVLV